jgi:16S rRNA processing protein RimM
VLGGIESIEEAERLRGRKLWFKRSDARLDDGEAFIAELLECSVIDAESGNFYGTITEVTPMPANDVWHITDERGREVLFPAVKDMIEEIDTQGGTVKIRPVKGIFFEN